MHNSTKVRKYHFNAKMKRNYLTWLSSWRKQQLKCPIVNYDVLIKIIFLVNQSQGKVTKKMNNFTSFFFSHFRRFGFSRLKGELLIKKFSEIALKAGLVYAPYQFMNRAPVHCMSAYPVTKNQAVQKNVLTISLSQDQQQWLETFRYLATHIARFLQLLYIFLPSLVMLPLRCFSSTEHLWTKAFVSAVEKAGVVWIKVFQYLSHRRDIIGPELAESFTHLRQKAPTHSFAETQRMFKEAYGKEIDEIFEQFDNVPIASGSVSQVYKAKYHSRKVAVKVRHPGVDTYIERDVELLFMVSKIGSWFSKSLNIPIGQESMKKTLVDQIDFNIEKDNLKAFNTMFYRNKHVRFPMAFESGTKDSILVQTFVEGLPITHFENNPHPLNGVIARIGAKTFFEMLMKNNFIHADCHGGNIIIEMNEPEISFVSEVFEYAKQKYYSLKEFLTEKAIKEENLKRIYNESKTEEAKMRKIMRRSKQNMKLTLIDAGMVIQLQPKDKQNFVSFVKFVIQSEGDKCAQMIYNLSNYNGKKIKKDQFPQYHEELQKVFAKINNQNLDNLEGMKLLTGMLDTIRDNNMKLDGEFATLLTNIVVLEGMARDLDPNINILKCAIPYFENNNHPIAGTAEKSFLTAV